MWPGSVATKFEGFPIMEKERISFSGLSTFLKREAARRVLTPRRGIFGNACTRLWALFVAFGRYIDPPEDP
jgi:hypothetical protein